MNLAVVARSPIERIQEFEGGNQRHVDLIWPLWNVLDLIPEGRGETWYPSLDYDE